MRLEPILTGTHAGSRPIYVAAYMRDMHPVTIDLPGDLVEPDDRPPEDIEPLR